MQASSSPAGIGSPSGAGSDIASKIALAMRAMGVLGLPRNYEIFYEVFTGSNHELNAALAALGGKPRQEDLDQLSVKYFVQVTNQLFVDNIRDQIANKVEEVMILFDKERIQLERYGSILNQTSDGLKKRETVSQDILHRIAGIMSAATETKIEQGRQFVETMIDKSTELEDVKSKLEEYKRLADTDALTQLQNRRAFDRAIARLFDQPKTAIYGSLILADIDHFKRINDRFGHPVGDRIIQHVASIFRALAPDEMLVARTGGEEFAVIAEGLSEDAVTELAESMRKAVERFSPTGGGNQSASATITASIGICMAAHATSADDMYSKADRALYASKANGRNQTTRFSELPDIKSSKPWLLYKRD